MIEVLDGQVGLPLTSNTDASRVGHSFLRMHNPPGRTVEPIVVALKAALERFFIATFSDWTPGVGLITDPDSAVTGVCASAPTGRRPLAE